MGLTSRRANERRATQVLTRFGITDIDPTAPVEALALAEKQRLEITRALWHARHLLVLDEPSASLTDTTWLFEQIRNVAQQGLAVLYISHRLSEVRSLCSRATVLRNGESIDSVDLQGVDDDRIFEMMVGRSPEEALGDADRPTPTGEPVLEVSGLTSGKARQIDFSLRRGEILGMAALEGQGQRDLFRALTGLAHVDSGEIRVGGKPTTIHSPRQALRAGPGIAFVPEERKTEGIFSSMRTAANITLPQAFRMSRFGFLGPRTEESHAQDTARRLDLQSRYLGFRIDALSGGNQQKAVIARALASGAGILVLFDPTRGVDVGTKQSIYRVIRDFADGGGAVLLYSSEIPELIELCGRCLVLYEGAITDELSGDTITEQSLISGIVGHRSLDTTAVAEAS
jgi:ribose transport system ATP-binding protein